MTEARFFSKLDRRFQGDVHTGSTRRPVAMQRLIDHFVRLYEGGGDLNGVMFERAAVEEVKAIVVLSGESEQLPDGTWVLDQMTLERLRFALAIAPQIEDAEVILCGADEQLGPMERAVAGLFSGCVFSVSAGPYLTANTKTQLQALARWARKEGIRRAIVISSLFHLLRVYLTALAQAPAVEWFPLGPYPEYEGVDPSVEALRVLGELHRIPLYAASGDIANPIVLEVFLAVAGVKQ